MNSEVKETNFLKLITCSNRDAMYSAGINVSETRKALWDNGFQVGKV